MARKPALSIEALTALGAAKLARLVLDEAQRSAPFRRLVSAALAGQKGPDAIAGIVDRRLSALEKSALLHRLGEGAGLPRRPGHDRRGDLR